jgi:hypothetical protein
MADLPPPVLLSVVVGECLHRGWGKRPFSILNIRNHIKSEVFPFDVEQLGVYVAVTEVVRDTQVAVRLVTPNSDVLAMGPTWDLKAGDPLFVHELGSDFGPVSNAERWAGTRPHRRGRGGRGKSRRVRRRCRGAPRRHSARDRDQWGSRLYR